MRYIYLDEMNWDAEIINGKKKLKARASHYLETDIMTPRFSWAMSEGEKAEWEEFLKGKRRRFIIAEVFSVWRVK